MTGPARWYATHPPTRPIACPPCCAALWLFLFAGCAQLTTAWAAIALPITALPSLLRGGAACRQLLSSPISAAPLARVYGMLSLAQ